jgi:hypothetical protein
MAGPFPTGRLLAALSIFYLWAFGNLFLAPKRFELLTPRFVVCVSDGMQSVFTDSKIAALLSVFTESENCNFLPSTGGRQIGIGATLGDTKWLTPSAFGDRP